MCGLAGYSGKPPVNVVMMALLLRENESRGKDSTGVHGNFLYKTDQSTGPFLASPTFRRAVSGSKSLIGHTRAATMGVKNAMNAHPFSHDTPDGVRVWGSHNGVIFPTVLSKLVEEYDEEIPNVDSEFVYRILALENLNFKKVIPLFEGTMALAFKTSKDPDELYLYRRSSRPLYVGIDNYNEIYYSSLSTSLMIAGFRNVIELPTDILHVFKHGVLTKMIDIPRPKITTLTLDQGLATWESKASGDELDAIGIKRYVARGVASNRFPDNRSEIGFRSRSSNNSLPTHIGKAGAGASVDAPLDSITTLDLEIEQANIIGHNKFVYVGDINTAYLLLKLVTAEDSRVSLPGWEVEIIGGRISKVIDTKLTTVNGVTALVIPDCRTTSETYTLKVYPPGELRNEATYSTVLPNIKGGRVLEVTLSIPFRWTEKEKKPLKSGTAPQGDAIMRRRHGGEGHHNLLSKSPEIQGFERRFPTIRKELENFKGVQSLIKSFDRSEKFDSEPDILWSFEGTPQERATANIENVIDMDYSTACITVNDGKELSAKLSSLLSDIDPNMEEIKSVSEKAVTFLDHLTYYFESRVAECEKEMEKESVNRVKNMIPDAAMSCDCCRDEFIPSLTLTCPSCGFDNDPRSNPTIAEK